MASYTQFICCCGAKTIYGVSSTKPEKIVFDYLKSQAGNNWFDTKLKRYVKGEKLFIKDAFLIWADPDRVVNTAWGSSGKLLCEYIVKHRLGSVTKTPLRHNPMHPERKLGKLDLRIWIWNINPIACQKWWEKHKPPSADPVTVSLLGKAPPIGAGAKNAAKHVCPPIPDFDRDDIPF